MYLITSIPPPLLLSNMLVPSNSTGTNRADNVEESTASLLENVLKNYSKVLHAVHELLMLTS